MPIILVLIAIATLSACATFASAQAPDPVAACLASVDAGSERNCIGASAGPCIEEPSGVTTIGMIQCYGRERELWTAQVNALVADLRARESPNQVASLDAMLAAHEPWMAARCVYSALYFEGGSLARVVSAACMRNTTAELAIDLIERRFED